MVGYKCNIFVFNVTSVTKHHILALHNFAMDITCFVAISLTTWWHYRAVAQPQLTTFHVAVLSTILTLNDNGVKTKGTTIVWQSNQIGKAGTTRMSSFKVNNMQ